MQQALEVQSKKKQFVFLVGCRNDVYGSLKDSLFWQGVVFGLPG